MPQIESFEITKLRVLWKETSEPISTQEVDPLLNQELLDEWIEMELIKAGPFGVNQWPD